MRNPNFFRILAFLLFFTSLSHISFAAEDTLVDLAAAAPGSAPAAADSAEAPASFASKPESAIPASYWTREATYMDKITHKLGFGVLNTLAGWTAVFFEPYYEGWEGLVTGPVYAVTNSAGGLVHAVTFPIPLDVPIPHGGISYEYNR